MPVATNKYGYVLTIVGRHGVRVRGQVVLLEWRTGRTRRMLLVPAQEDVGEGAPQVLLLLLLLMVVGGHPAAHVAASAGILQIYLINFTVLQD